MYGKHISDDGKINYFSASQLTTADHNSDGGCQRKWYYDKVLKIKSPQSEAQAEGDRYHKVFETYLTRGEISDPIVLKASDYFPKSDYAMEAYPENLTLPCFKVESEVTSTFAAGVPCVGKKDVVEYRSPYEAVITDWKFTSDLGYADSNAKTKNRPQSILYAIDEFNTHRTIETVASRFVFVPKKSKDRHAVASVAIYKRADLPEMQKRIDTLAAPLIQLALKKPDAKDVPANVSACNSFGGCFYRGMCQENQAKVFHSEISKLVGEKNAMNFANLFQKDATLGSVAQATIARPSINPPPIAVQPANPPTVAEAAAQILAEEQAIVSPSTPVPSTMGEPLAVEAPKKRGRPPGIKKVEEVTATYSPEAQTVQAQTVQAQTVQAQNVQLYLNAIPNGPYSDFRTYADELLAAIAKELGVSDIRLEKANERCAFGAWKVTLALAAKAVPPPVGVYVLISADPTDAATLIAEALSNSPGVQFVRGVR